jgi:hypothetical protein
MAEQATQVEGTTITAETKLAREMKAKTEAAFKAVQQAPPGIDSDSFGKELQAAIDKDLGKAPSEPQKEPDPEPKPIQSSTKPPASSSPPESDSSLIPSELFGSQPAKEEQQKPDQTEDDRKKYIEEQTKGMSLNAAAKFKAIEQKEHEARQQAKELQKKVSEMEAAHKKAMDEHLAKLQAMANPKELEELRGQVSKLDEALQRQALLDHPKFKAAFDNKIESWIDVAKKYVPQEKAAEVSILLRQKDSPERNAKIDEIAESIDASLNKTKFLNLVNDIDKVSADREVEVSQWKENKKRLEEAEANERAKQMEQGIRIQKKNSEQLNAIWNEAQQRLASKEAELEWFQKLEGNDKWNQEVDDRLKSVRALAEDEMPQDKLYELSALALSAPMFRRMFLEERARVMKLSGEVAALRGASPNLSSGGGASSDGSGVSENDDYITASERQLVKLGHLR